MPAPVAIGIDIGSHSIKVAQVRKTSQGYALLAAGTVPLGELAQEPEGKGRNAKIGLLLRGLMRNLRVRGKLAAASVPGRRLFFRYVHVPPVPAWRLKALMEYEIEEEETESKEPAAYDFRLLDLPNKATEFTVMITMAKNDVPQASLDVLKEAGVSADDIYPGTVALFNAFRGSCHGEIEDASILLNVGADSSDMVLQSQGRFFFARNLTNGGNAFSEALLDEFQISFEEAENLKLQKGKILPADFDDEEKKMTEEVRTSDALSNAADGIANAIQTSLMYCRAQLKLADVKPQKILLCGGGALIPGLAEYLGSRLRLEVQPLDPSVQFDASQLPKAQAAAFHEQPGRFTTAIGLALSALAKPGMVTLSLLPEKEKKRRQFYRTDSYVWSAAVCLLIALGISIYVSRSMAIELGEKQTLLTQRLDEAKLNQKKMEERRVVVDRSVAKVDALLLRAYSSREIFDLMTTLTDPSILPKEINFTEIKIQPSQPLALHPESLGPPETPSERVVLVSGNVRTVVPPPLDIEKAKLGEKPAMPEENYKLGLEVIKNFGKALEGQGGIIYKVKVTRANTDPERQKRGEPLTFGLSIELAPKTVEGREYRNELARRTEVTRLEAEP